MIQDLLIAVALAMDCFAVSVVCGVVERRMKAGVMLRLAFLFGFFQALMPLIGWVLTSGFREYLEAVDHWIAFGMLALIGGKMIIDAFKEEEQKSVDPEKMGTRILLAVATSIDALAVGISYACDGHGHDSLGSLAAPLLTIGVVSFLLSLAGFAAGVRFGGSIVKKIRPELLGGIILVAIGIKILLEHLGVL